MAIAKQAIKNHFSPSEKIISPNGGKDRKPAKQEFKDDADINSIMKKFQKTGAIDHAKIYQGYYGEQTGQSLQEAQQTVANAQNMFADLPSSIRKKFENSPAKFLDYVQDPANAVEASELGISLSPEAAEKAAIEAAEAAELSRASLAQEAPAAPEEQPSE